METIYYEKELLVLKTYFYYEKEALWESSSVMDIFSYKEASVWKRSSFSVKEVLLWENISIMRRKFFRKNEFYYEKEVLLWNKLYYDKEILQWKNMSTENRKIYYGKITSL